jgi:ADP-ribosylglycohydrolase
MDLASRMKSAIFAGIVGDALGVPVEHSTRQELSLCAVKNLLGYGRYDQPEGTWSDDTSMVLCTMESLSRGYDLEDIAKVFCGWLFDGKWTATGYVFDSGLTTFMALERYRAGKEKARQCGCRTDDDNGNGSLMRILPAALCFHTAPIEPFLEAIHDISAITHAHPRSKCACGVYSLLVRHLLTGRDKAEAYRAAVADASDYYAAREAFAMEMAHFSRVLSGRIPELSEDDISSSGYVVDTLEAALWCFLRFGNTKDVLLAAVNLGLDTDTTGMVAGGLAGTCYGLGDLPEAWLESVARKAEIDQVVESFVASVGSR